MSSHASHTTHHHVFPVIPVQLDRVDRVDLTEQYLQIFPNKFHCPFHVYYGYDTVYHSVSTDGALADNDALEVKLNLLESNKKYQQYLLSK